MFLSPTEGNLNFNGYLRVTEAADLLGVHADTLRRWEKTGKLKVHRHPINGYRLFIREQLEKLLQEIRSQ